MLDVVTGRYVPPVVYWFRGLKDGGFGERLVLQQEDAAVEKKYSMSTTNLADLDGDGLLDLVIGDTKGSVFFARNTGSDKAPKFGPRQPLRVGEQDLKVSHKSDPLPIDWDGDGTLDLLVGDECGDVTFFKGTGKQQFAPGVSLFTGLQVDPKDNYQKAKAKLDPHRVIPGYRRRLCASDWNGDGKLDLLVGNCETEAGSTMGYVYVLLRR